MSSTISSLRLKLGRRRANHLLKDLGAKKHIEIGRSHLVILVISNESTINDSLGGLGQRIPRWQSEVLIHQTLQSTSHDRSIESEIIVGRRLVQVIQQIGFRFKLRRSIEALAVHRNNDARRLFLISFVYNTTIDYKLA